MHWTMKKEVRVSRLRSLNSFVDKLTFTKILLIWTGILVLFGILYYVMAGEGSYLLYNKTGVRVTSLFDSIYFSFVTATSTGFGDIVPLGLFKLFAIIEVVFGLVLLAVVTSKLISIKQDAIMSEIYDISFSEKVNRIRSSLLLFRQNLGRLISNIESGTVRKREISDIYNYFSSFEDCLHEIGNIVEKDPNDQFTKTLDPMSTELVFNSINQSFDKLSELINLMANNKIEWKRDITLKLLEECLMTNAALMESLQNSKSLPEKIFTDLNIQNKKAVSPIKECVKTSPKFGEIQLEKL